ncbi:hypothetical protein PITC_059100 [Penicillium italicum]|uniref:Uncharacterized protein n=1 Tax=Penicillium italicum TaxID=40296 RepID=A0A0A2LDW2_PENIT|nr:hypothetical protein PITC_059100 [Penicillium italicum]
MGIIVSILCRPRVLPQITVALNWVSPKDIVSLVQATKTLEFKRREFGKWVVIATSATDIPTTPSTDQTEDKDTEQIADRFTQGYIYYLQTKALDRPIHYISHIRLIVLDPGRKIIAPGVQIMGPPARSFLVCLEPVLPPKLLQKINLCDNNTLSATQSLGYILSGVDQFADWESGWGELIHWWFLLLRPYWFSIAFALMFVPLLITVLIIVFAR